MYSLPTIDPEFRGLIPPLSREEREQLEHNILASGECREAIILWDNTIIDGHNRYDICTKHGIEFGIREVSFDCRTAAKIWILNEQMGRRNLNDAARIEIVLKKAELLKELAKKNQIRAGRDRHGAGQLSSKTTSCQKNPIDVQKTLATEAGVSVGTFSNYNQLKDHATPQLLEKVQSDEMKIGAAHKLLGKQLVKQFKLAEGMLNYIAKNIPVECNDTNHTIYTQLHEINALHTKLTDALKGELAHGTKN
jgi:hypothetical protein